MRKITETEYQMGEREFKEKLGLEGEILTMIIVKKSSTNKSNNQVIAIKMKSLKVEK